jgi:hypothetical protein
LLKLHGKARAVSGQCRKVSKHLFDNDEIDDSLAHFSIPLTERRVMVNKSTMGELFFV